MKSEKGFAAILLISLLPVILAGGLAFYTIFGFLKGDLATLNICRARQMEVQNKAGRNLAKLLKLNPQALKLRLEQFRAEKALLMALETGTPPAIAAAEAYLLTVKMRRQTLDIRQKVLIETTNTWLSSAGTMLPRQLQQEWQRHNNPLTSWLPGSLVPNKAAIPTLAVEADIPEVAPVYQQKINFEDAQAWQQSWRIQVQTAQWAGRFLKFNGRFERSCSTSLYADGTDWIAKMKKAKSLLKGFL